MFTLCFLMFAYAPVSLTPTSHFGLFCESLLMLYLIYPFQTSISVSFGVLFSFLFEILATRKQLFSSRQSLSDGDNSNQIGINNSYDYSIGEMATLLAVKCLLHASVHLVGLYLKLSLQTLKRATFIKVSTNN